MADPTRAASPLPLEGRAAIGARLNEPPGQRGYQALWRWALADLCDRYLATIQHQKPKTGRRKQDIAAAIKRDFPGGANTFIDKVVPSKVLVWLASYDFGAPSYNLYLEFTRAIFSMAVGDHLLAHSLIEHLKGKN